MWQLEQGDGSPVQPSWNRGRFPGSAASNCIISFCRVESEWNEEPSPCSPCRVESEWNEEPSPCSPVKFSLHLSVQMEGFF